MTPPRSRSALTDNDDEITPALCVTDVAAQWMEALAAGTPLRGQWPRMARQWPTGAEGRGEGSAGGLAGWYLACGPARGGRILSGAGQLGIRRVPEWKGTAGEGSPGEVARGRG